MTKQELEAFAKEAVKGLKSHQDPPRFQPNAH